MTPIPKVTNPKEISELRNISGLMNLDKVMEKIICARVIEDMKASLDPQQFANQKGLSIQHYLIAMLDKILAAVDKNSKDECWAVMATMVDWREAFPRQDPTLGLQSFIENGVRPSLIPIIMSYFEGRQMYVQWHGKTSTMRKMPGGGPQGSTFGIWSYLSQSNNNAECIERDCRYKFVDDLTFLELINLLNIGMASHNIKNQVPSNIPSSNLFIPAENLKSQQYLEKINEWSDNQKMILHPKKTKSIIFNFTKGKQFSTEMKIKGEKVEVVEQSKLLGVILRSDLKWSSNTQKIVTDANKRLRLLHAASQFTTKTSDLKIIYMAFIRSKLEQSSVVWHSSLTEDNRRDLERVQKAAVKIILRRSYTDYEEALKILNLESLDQRRSRLCLKFAKNCLKNEKMKKLFPLASKNHNMDTRLKEKFKVNKAHSERYKKSAVPFMQNLLNQEARKIQNILV